jgi:F-type H+-transporting ATPase subunit a
MAPFILILNPLEQFEIVQYIAMEGPLFGHIQIGLANAGFYLLVASIFLIVLHRLHPTVAVLGLGNRLMLCLESLFGSLLQVVKDQVSPAGQHYFPAIYSLFVAILFLNLVGLIPYSFTATAHFVLTLGFSTTIVVGVSFLGLRIHGLNFFTLFIPAGTPVALLPMLVLIETVSYLARAFSLGIRLSANMLAGHILLHIIANFSWNFVTSAFLGVIIIPLPLLILSLLYGLEIGVGLIQAYVFVLLACNYIKDAISLHSINSPLLSQK